MGRVYERRGTAKTDAEERTDKFMKALKLYKKALRARRAAMGEHHVYVAFTLFQMGRFHRIKDCNITEATRRYQEALTVYKNNNMDKHHPYVKAVLEDMAL